MTYNEFIQNIIETRGQWNIPEGVDYENHHIIPICMGGEPQNYTHTTKHSNLIWLTYKEHYEAHKLLYLENKDNPGLALSWHRLHYDKKHNVYLNCEEYSILKDAVTIANKKLHKGKKRPQSFSDKMSIIMKGKNNPMYGKHTHGSKGIPCSEENKILYRKVLGRKIMCIETNRVYDSMREMEKNVGIGRNNIRRAIKLKDGYYKGYHWKYV